MTLVIVNGVYCMSNVSNIGIVISKLRKNKGVTQEELAKYVGVSAQAVSKWENGGVPDTELLPKIADYFEVSIDRLFGRDYSNINMSAAIFNHIRNTEPDSQERFKTIFDLCWDIERSIFQFSDIADAQIINGGKIKDYESINGTDGQQYSSIISNYGFTRMGIASKLQYFLCVPEIKNKQMALFDGIDYTELFKDLSDKDVFNAFLFLFKRESYKSFTENLFVKELGVDFEKSKEIIKVLTKYYLLKKVQIELDDETKDVYTFYPTPSFVSLLIFARELIDRPQNFAFWSEGRTKPYLE